MGALLGATVDMVTSQLIEMIDKHDVAPLPNLSMVLFETGKAGSITKRRRPLVYKTAPKLVKYSFCHFPIINIF